MIYNLNPQIRTISQIADLAFIINKKRKIKLRKQQFTSKLIISILKSNKIIFEPLNNRKRPIVQNRHIALYLCCELTKESLSTIGYVFKKDHSSVLHAKKTITNLMDVDKEVYNMVNEYRNYILNL